MTEFLKDAAATLAAVVSLFILAAIVSVIFNFYLERSLLITVVGVTASRMALEWRKS